MSLVGFEDDVAVEAGLGELADEFLPIHHALARQAGISSGSDTIALRALKSALVRLRRSLDLPDSLAKAGAKPADVRKKMDSLVAAALADPCCGSNPVRADEASVRRLITEALGHG